MVVFTIGKCWTLPPGVGSINGVVDPASLQLILAVLVTHLALGMRGLHLHLSDGYVLDETAVRLRSGFAASCIGRDACSCGKIEYMWKKTWKEVEEDMKIYESILQLNIIFYL